MKRQPFSIYCEKFALGFGQAIDFASGADRTRTTAMQMTDFQRLFEANLESLKVYFSKEEYERSKRWRQLPINLAKTP